MDRTFCIVGAGTVGTALARLLTEAGWPFAGAASRSRRSAETACEFAGMGRASTRAADLTAEAGLVFITTPDDVIGSVCEDLAAEDAFRDGSVVAHCSGALPSSVLASARACGASVGSLHPMQSFATAEQAVRILPGSCCCVEGDPQAVTLLRHVAETLDAHVIAIATEDKPLYHAAGCVASNYLVALQHAALKLTDAAGISREDAVRMLVPLVKGTAANFAEVGIPDCLTGPISRGDVETVRRHLRAIERAVPKLLPLYRVMGREAVEVGRAKGTLSSEAASTILDLLR
ncbi:MAG: Rossmann-like and DUF2520 domain-containing protein [Candidatus Brocadiia bacterium]